MKNFCNVPVYESPSFKDLEKHICILDYSGKLDFSFIRNAIETNKIVLIRSITFKTAGSLFANLIDHYNLRPSYEIQMQLVPHLIDYRDPVNDIAVTVNKRGAYQFIQPHCEGYSGTPLELFGLHCTQNSKIGGENILSRINQNADHSRLRAKEKIIIGKELSSAELNNLRRNHLDANEVVSSCDSVCKIIEESENGVLAVRASSIKPDKSPISGETVVTYWDNITVHDHAFHRHQYEMLHELGIFIEAPGLNYKDYIHIEEESYCAPIDTDSGTTEQTAQLFDIHLLYKMQENDLILLNNRVWAHSVNNWPSDQARKMSAFYA